MTSCPNCYSSIEVSTCKDCKNETCKDCTDFLVCGTCSEESCEPCVEDSGNTSSVCNAPYCPACNYRKNARFCSQCDGFICSECLDDSLKHFEGSLSLFCIECDVGVNNMENYDQVTGERTERWLSE